MVQRQQILKNVMLDKVHNRHLKKKKKKCFIVN